MKLSGAITLAGAALGTVSFCALNSLVHKALIRRDFEIPEKVSSFMSEVESDTQNRPETEAEIWFSQQTPEEHTLINDRGQKLQGYLLKPKKPSDVYVFGSHGYRSDGMGEWRFYAKHYVEELSYNMFFVDHQSAGRSEGEYIGFSSYESVDSLKWLSYMTETFGKDIKIILHGISMGSATVMLMSGNESLPENVRFTIADCGFTSAYDEFTYKLKNLKLPTVPLVPAISFINRRKVGYDFKNDTNALEAVKKAKVPMLFVHGGKDKFVPTYMAYLLHHNCNSEYKDILIVEGADHAESYLVDKEAYEKKISEFSEKFI